MKGHDVLLGDTAPSPVPVICERLTPCSRAILRTSGRSGLPLPFVAACCAGGALAVCAELVLEPASSLPSFRAGARCGRGSSAASAAASPSTAHGTTTVFTPTVVPSETLISCRTPEAGAGISASTLSVEISNNGSSRCTLSPGFFSHLVIVLQRWIAHLGHDDVSRHDSFHAAHVQDRGTHANAYYSGWGVGVGKVGDVHGWTSFHSGSRGKPRDVRETSPSVGNSANVVGELVTETQPDVGSSVDGLW